MNDKYSNQMAIDPMYAYTEWRKEEEQWVSYWSKEQKDAENVKKYDLARWYGECKRESLKHLKRINEWIAEDMRYTGQSAVDSDKLKKWHDAFMEIN